jgi:hypothetical protein
MNLLLRLIRAPIHFVFRHPWWSLLLVTLAFFTSTVGVYKFVEYRSYCDLEAAMAETDAVSPRWRWEEIEADRPEIPDAENSALVIQKVADLRKLAEQQSPPTFEIDLVDALRKRDEINHRVPDAKLAKFRQAMAAIQPALDEAAKLKSMPRGRWRIRFEPDGISTPMPHLGTVRGVARLLGARALQASHDNDSANAADCVVGTFQAARSLTDEPMLISQMVGYAIQGLAIAEVENWLALDSPSTSDLHPIELQLNQELASFDLRKTMSADRGMLHAFYNSMERDGMMGYQSLMGARPSATLDALSELFYQPLLPADHAFALRMLNTGVEIASKPIDEHPKHWQNWDETLKRSVLRGPWVYRNVIAESALPALPSILEKSIFTQTHLHVVLAAIAAERFYRERKAWPRAVDELVPNYLPEMPIDPFDGKPLRIAQRADGITIYSIGPNRDDDNGTIDEEDSYKGDLVFRLWNHDQRGLPALPEKPSDPQ